MQFEMVELNAREAREALVELGAGGRGRVGGGGDDERSTGATVSAAGGDEDTVGEGNANGAGGNVGATTNDATGGRDVEHPVEGIDLEAQVVRMGATAQLVVSPSVFYDFSLWTAFTEPNALPRTRDRVDHKEVRDRCQAHHQKGLSIRLSPPTPNRMHNARGLAMALQG